jgi:hypothetical protein
VKVPDSRRSSESRCPRVMRCEPRGAQRSVGRGAYRPAIEPRKAYSVPSADVLLYAEGNTDGRARASVHSTRRGLRPWHVRTLLVREPGDLLTGPRRQYSRVVRIGKARSRSR